MKTARKRMSLQQQAASEPAIMVGDLIVIDGRLVARVLHTLGLSMTCERVIDLNTGATTYPDDVDEIDEGRFGCRMNSSTIVIPRHAYRPIVARSCRRPRASRRASR